MRKAAAPADPPAAGRAGPVTAGPAGPADLAAARRIAIVNWRDPWHPQAGGAERYAWELARRFAARGAEVTFVAGRAPGQRRRDRVEGVEFVRLGGRFTIYPLVLAWMLAHRSSFDAVLDCQNGIPFYTPWVLPRRVPVLCVVHHVHVDQFGMYFPAWLARLGRFLEGPMARRAYRRHACVAVSPSTVTAMRERLRWTGPIHVVPNGVAVPDIPGDAVARDGISADTASGGRAPAHAVPGGSAAGDAAVPDVVAGDAVVREAVAAGAERGEDAELVCVTRLVPHKRVAELLDVAERLRVRVHVVGRGSDEEALRAEIARRGLAGLVELHGYLPEPDKIALVARARLHLSASRGEGWGLSVTEAAALGVPTVAYDVEGLRDAVLDGVTGWLAGDGEHLTDAVERALKELADPSRRREVAAACREWAAEFGWARSAARMSALLDAAVRRGMIAGRRDAAPRAAARAAASQAAAPAATASVGTASDGAASRDDAARAAAARVAAARAIAPQATAPEATASGGTASDDAASRGTASPDAVPSGPLCDAPPPSDATSPGARPLGTGPPGRALPDAVVVRYGETERVVEGPVRDELLDRLDPARTHVRPATDLERLLGHTGRWAR